MSTQNIEDQHDNGEEDANVQEPGDGKIQEPEDAIVQNEDANVQDEVANVQDYAQEMEIVHVNVHEVVDVQEVEVKQENQNGQQTKDEQKKKRGKYVKKNFLPNGTISVERRTGKARTDAYAARSTSLIKNCQHLYSITGAEVSIIIQPTWPQGKAKMYESPGFQADPNFEAKVLWGMKVPESQRGMTQIRFDGPTTSAGQQAPVFKKKSHRSKGKSKKKRKHNKRSKRYRTRSPVTSSDSSDSESSESSSSSSSWTSSDSEDDRKKRKAKQRKKKLKKQKKQQKKIDMKKKRKQIEEVFTSSSLSSADEER